MLSTWELEGGLGQPYQEHACLAIKSTIVVDLHFKPDLLDSCGTVHSQLTPILDLCVRRRRKANRFLGILPKAIQYVWYYLCRIRNVAVLKPPKRCTV